MIDDEEENDCGTADTGCPPYVIAIVLLSTAVLIVFATLAADVSSGVNGVLSRMLKCTTIVLLAGTVRRLPVGNVRLTFTKRDAGTPVSLYAIISRN